MEAQLIVKARVEMLPGAVSGKTRGYLSGVRPNHHIVELGYTVIGSMAATPKVPALQVSTDIMTVMPTFQPALAAVCELESSPDPMRVIASDDLEVMCDVWWSDSAAWGMARLSGNISDYRLPRRYVEANARYLRTDALSEEELRVHRPDLPFAVAQRRDVSWYQPAWHDDDFGTAPLLAASRIHLAPFGPRDSSKPSSLLVADDGTAFTEAELLAKARILQSPFIGDVCLTDGGGIYRAGVRKRLPSYYLWGAKSRAEAPSTASSHAARSASRG